MAKRPPDGGFNDRVKLFIAAYVKDPNGRQAAIAAGYSAKTADVQASRLLRNVKVRMAVDAAIAELARKTGVSAERTMREEGRIGYSDARKLFDKDGSLIPIHELDDETAASIASVEVFEEFEGRGEDRKLVGFTKKIKLWDKNTALTNLMKHYGLLKERVEHTGAGGGPIVTETRDYSPLLKRFRAGGK